MKKRLEFSYVAKFLPEKPVIVDIGAYVGRIFDMCKALKIDAEIHAVEPDPTNFDVMYTKYYLTKNAYFYDYAIASKECRAPLYIGNRPECEGTSASNSLFRDPLRSKHRIGKIKKVEVDEVVCITMKRFIELSEIKHIDLLMINAEGGEYEMFEDPSFLDITDIVFMSLHSKHKPFSYPKYKNKRFAIKNSLMEHGFDLNSSVNKSEHIWQLWIKK